MHNRLLVVSVILQGYFAVAATPATPPVPLNVNFNTFLARSDPIWSYNTSAGRPSEWVSSLFGGNGELGFLLWSPDLLTLRIDISRQSLYDDRTADLGLPLYLNNFVFDQPRLPVGHFILTWASNSQPTAITGRVSLYDARAMLNVTTPVGGISIALWACAAFNSADVIVMEVSSSGSESASIVFVPEIAQSTWSGRDSRYVQNPPPLNVSRTLGKGVSMNLTTQPHLKEKGTGHTTAVLQQHTSPSLDTFFVAISPVSVSTDVSDEWATTQVQAAQSLGIAHLRSLHEAWWHTWWPAGGFISVEYSILESFWFIQLYKLASAARAGRSVHDLEGPWFIAGTDWPDLHWDLNLQYTYYLPMALGRADIASTLVDFVAAIDASGALVGNVPEEWRIDSAAAPTGASSIQGIETCYWSYGANCTTSPPSVTGNLLWTLSLVHLAALHTANSTIDTDVVWPILGKALMFYAHFSETRADGSVHLLPTFSPEYPGPPGADANFDISLYRWGLKLALDLASEYSLTSPNLPFWRSTLENMTWFPIDAVSDTLEIYENVPYGIPHRHFAHLFSIWPLHLLNVSNASQFTTARNSINRWLATPEADSMFYRPAASAMNVLLGQKAAAFDNITYLMHNRIEGSTFYREGSQGSCTETPYAAAWAITDWMLQSWNTTTVLGGELPVIDFFPAMSDVIFLNGSAYESAPARASTARFWRLAAAGGVLASGSRELVSVNATHYVTRTAFLAVESPANVSPARQIIVRTSMSRPLTTSPAGVSLTELGDGGLVLVGLQPGQGAAIFSASLPPSSLEITPSIGCPAQYNFWGRRAVAGGNATTPVVLRNCTGALTQAYAFDAVRGTFSLQDGSGRCLAVSSCAGQNGDLVVLAPCAESVNNGPIGCEGSECASSAQVWSVKGPGEKPPNAIINTLSGRCMDVNGAFDPNTIDVYDCSYVPGADKNEEFKFDAVDGTIKSLDTNACCLGMCLTPME